MDFTVSQAQQFRQVGYVRIPQAIEPELVRDLRVLVAAEHAASQATQSEPTTMYDFYDRSPGLLWQLVSHPAILGSLRPLLGPNIVLVKNRHNQASINAPGQYEFRLHRDVLQPSRDVITAVVFLEGSTVDNGCTWLVPGSHLWPTVGVSQPGGGGTWMDEHEEFASMQDQALPIPLPAGGLLIFDGMVFHSVGNNTSTSTRTAIVLGYRSVDELDRHPDTARLVLVDGAFIYRGNDHRAR